MNKKILNDQLRHMRLALRTLKANMMRSVLTTLGIIIGVITVIMVFALGQGTQNLIQGELLAYGSNTVFVEVKVPGFSDTNPGAATALVEGVTITTLKPEDMNASLDIPGVTNAYAAVISQEKVSSLYDTQRYMIQGTSSTFTDIDQSDVEIGRFFTDAEDRSMTRVAVIGQSVAEELFSGTDPLNQTLRVKGVNFRIIGIMKELGLVGFQDMDKQVYIPLKAMQKLILGINYVPYYVIQVENDTIAPLVKEDLIQLLDYRHNITKPEGRDFRVTTMEEAADMISVITDALQLLLAVLAAISLLVGGVGVMNIMFVAVTERTREIGLRKAVGATPKAIMLQFLWESIMITALGGTLGIIIGLSMVWLFLWGASFAGIDIEFFIPVTGILIAIGAAILEGLIFGLYPAKKAASLHPIESLRYE
jgi:putative ABC transport system permease protein